MSKYIAKQSIGHFRPGQEIKGLEAKQLQALLASGAIEEYQEREDPKADGTAARLAELEKANAELTAANRTLTEANQAAVADKAKADQEVAELKAKVAELEKANAELTAANKTLTEANQAAVADKAKADQEVAELKAKVAELEKAKSAAKPKADPKSADETK